MFHTLCLAFLHYRHGQLSVKVLIPVECIPKPWKTLEPSMLKKSHLTFLCTRAWPTHPLEPEWNAEGSINYDIFLLLKANCKNEKIMVRIV